MVNFVHYSIFVVLYSYIIMLAYGDMIQYNMIQYNIVVQISKHYIYYILYFCAVESRFFSFCPELLLTYEYTFMQ